MAAVRHATGHLEHIRTNIAITLLALLVISDVKYSQQQPDSVALLKTEPFYIDLEHKLGSQAEFTPRGSILIKPRTEYRPAQATFVQHNDLSESDLKLLRHSSEQDELYHLRAICRRKKAGKSEEPLKVTQTIIKSCSLQAADLVDFITVNLSPLNEFLSINLHTADQDCSGQPSEALSAKFNTTLTISSASPGPQPDTASYIKRLEEERQSKAKEGKEDNRSFLAKYWIYIVPGVIILMMLGGPEQGAR